MVSPSDDESDARAAGQAVSVRTLMTGAAGFTGRYLARELARRGHAVHAVVHGEPVTPIDDVAKLHVADLADRAAIGAIVDDVRPDHVVHLAGIAYVGHGDIEEMYRSNIVGTRQLLDALAQLPEAPASVLLASSANVYGNAREGVLDESMPYAPVNDYGVTKVATELVARLYAGRLPLIVVRPFNYTGRGQSDHFLIPKIVAHVRRRAAVIELGNLDVARDFSDVRVVADAYARLLAAPQAIGETFNICSGRAVSLRDLVEMVRTVSGQAFEVTSNPGLMRAHEVKVLAGSAAKLEQAIGPLLRIPLEDTLRWMLDA